MARFYSITLKGTAHQVLVVNTFWYRQDALAMPTTEDLVALRTAWLAANQTDWLAIHTNGYMLEEVIVQGYSDDFDRQPYLPHSHAMAAQGADVSASMPPVVAAILSAKVEPAFKQQRSLPTEPFRESHVRRAYWAVGPVSELDVGADGTFSPAKATTGPHATFRDRIAADLVVTGWSVPGKPVAVANPPKDVPRRGWGWIRQGVWGTAISTRRSRKLGKGA